MSNIVTATIEIEGTRPLLWHHFGPEALPLEKQERTGVAGNDPWEWQATVLHTKDGQLYLPPTYAFGCLRDGARYTKKGRGTLQKTLVATLQVTDDRILVDRYIPGFNGKLPEPDEMPRDPEELVYLDVRGVSNPGSRGRNIRYRVAASPGWRATFHILFDKTIVSRNEMHSVAIDAGRLVGLGDGRSIGMGRFDVVGFAADD